MSLFDESLAPRTRFDVNFRLGDVAVRVHPFFWLTTLLLGLPRWTREPQPSSQIAIHLLLWIAVVFVSIVVHELGHVLMGRYFGSRGHIVLTGFCGLAIGSADLPERWQRNLVSLAGPAAGFLLAAVFAAGCWLVYPEVTVALLASLVGVEVPVTIGAAFPPLWLGDLIFMVLWVNVLWGLVNLLPIWPLDGGQVSRETFQHCYGRDGLRRALILSIVVAGGMAALALIEYVTSRPLIPHVGLFGGSLFPVLFFGLLALQSWQLLKVVRHAGPDWDREQDEPRQPWERDADWWKRGGGRDED